MPGGLTDEQHPSSGDRNRTLLIGAAVLAVVAVLVITLVLRDDSDTASDTNSSTTTEAGAANGVDATDSSVALTSPPGDPDADPAPLPADLTPVAGDSEAQLCEAILVRIGEYRDAVAAEIPSPELLDALEEFEAQVDSQSDDQDWGDRIIEQMVNARRELVTAVGASSDGDEAAAASRQEAGVDRLDRAIDEAGCPTN